MDKVKLKIQEKFIRLSTVTLYDIIDTLSIIAGAIICLFSIGVAIIERTGIMNVPDLLMVIGFCMFPCGILVLLIGVVKKLS